MRWMNWKKAGLVVGALVFGLLCLPGALEACTRCVLFGKNDIVVVARSMDWMEDPGTNLYAFPKGIKRDGVSGKDSITWTSKYGSVVCSFYEVASVDGMNEKGLVANVLYLVESDYGTPDGTKPLLSISAWAQYVLDNYATVAEAVEDLKKEPFAIMAPTLPNGSKGHGHLSISDPSGDSAIFEYVKGKLVVHHSRQYQVMTNSPTFDEQLALNKYWEQIGGVVFLPGTNRASDRFARASFFVQAVPKSDDILKTVAGSFSIIRAVSVPLGISVEGQPNIASTIWRTVHDQKNRVFYFDSATSPNAFWVPLVDLDLKEGAPIKKLTVAGGKTYSGNAADKFQPAESFKFLPGK